MYTQSSAVEFPVAELAAPRPAGEQLALALGLLPRTGAVTVPATCYLVVKRVLDVSQTLVLLVLSAPIVLVTCLLVKPYFVATTAT